MLLLGKRWRCSGREQWSLFLLLILVAIIWGWGSNASQARQGPLNPPPSGPKVVSGYAWSPHIGWISFDNNGVAGTVDYGVILGAPSGDGSRSLSGYAWNPHIGWIRFDPSINNLLASSEAAPPTSDSPWGVKLDASLPGGDKFSGWARACVVFENNCSGVLKSDNQRGGWDGWIKFRGGTADGGSSYTTAADSASNPSRFIGGHRDAWGSDILGWISLCGNDTAYPPYLGDYCVSFANVTSSCQIIGPAEDGNGLTTVADGGQLIWRGQVSGGTPPYYLEWNGAANASYDPSSSGGSIGDDPVTTLDASVFYSCGGDEDIDYGEQAATFSALDANDGSTACQAATRVLCSATQEPTGGTGLGDLSTNLKDIVIVGQPIASPAISSATKFSNLAATSSITVKVKSISSLSSLGSPPDLFNHSSVSCQMRLGDAVGNDPGVNDNFVSCPNALLTLPANASGYFNLQISPPLPANLSAGSPYKITIANSDPADATNDRSFLFHYSVGTVNPL